MPKSKKLWLQAAKKELDPRIRIQVLKKALEQIPESIDIWKEVVSLETPENAKILLY